MQIETVAAAFAEFEQQVLLPADYGSLNRRDSRFSFYAGARAIMRMLATHGDNRIARFRAIVDELERFVSEEVLTEAEAEANETPKEPE